MHPHTRGPNCTLCGGNQAVKCVIQFVDALSSVIVFAQFHVREILAGIFSNSFDLLLDQPNQFASNLFQITPLHSRPLVG
jgi:hypothetical protein